MSQARVDTLQRYINELHRRLDDIVDLCADESLPLWEVIEAISLIAAPDAPSDDQLEMELKGSARLRLVGGTAKQ